MSRLNQPSPEAVDLMWDIAGAINTAHDELTEAAQNRSDAKRLDSIHSLGSAVLDNFEADLVNAQATFEHFNNLMPDLTQYNASPFAMYEGMDRKNSVDSEPLKISNELRVGINEARRLALGDYLHWDGQGNFDRRPSAVRVFGDPARPEFLKSVRGKIIVVQRRGLSPLGTAEDEQEPDAIYLVGGLGKDSDGKGYPNPRFKVLNLLPRPLTGIETISSHPLLKLMVNGIEEPDAESLGFISNCYFHDETFRYPFEKAYGHAFGYECEELGAISVPFPESGDPADIQIYNPKTPADHLVKLALESKRLIERARLALVS